MTGIHVRIILAAAAAVLTAMLLYILCSASKEQRKGVLCKDVEIAVLDSARLDFVTRDDVRAYLSADNLNPVGKELDSVDLGKIEKSLNGKSAVLESQAYATKDGTVHIEISQRKPAILFRNGLHSYYSDEKGFIFPVSKNYADKIVTVDGAIPINVSEGFKGRPATEGERKWLEGMLNTAARIRNDKTWKNAIGRISVEGDGDLVLYPVSGKERFIFGKPEGLKSKFGRMEDYYRYIVPAKGKGFYSTINVKFDGQIVCKEK